MRLLGPADLMGTRQSGALQLKVADWLQDQGIRARGRAEVARLLDNDPMLQREEYKDFNRAVETQRKQLASWGRIS